MRKSLTLSTIVAALVFSNMGARADEAAKTPPEKVFSLKVSESELNVLGQLLAKAPYEIAAPILADLQKQVSAQVQEPEKSKK